jgi:hypothetical protein
MGLISRTISAAMSEFDRRSFGVWIAVAIASGVGSQMVMRSEEQAVNYFSSLLYLLFVLK